MPRLTIVQGPYNGGAMTALYDVTSDDGSTGILATSDEQEFAVSEVIDAPPTPPHLRRIEFNGHLIDYFLPPS